MREDLRGGPVFNVLIYRRTSNLGDAIQTVALSRLLGPRLGGVYRDAAHKAPADITFVVNGWLGDTPGGRNTLFAGIHIAQNLSQMVRWVKDSDFPVGSRDPHTQAQLRLHGIRSEMIACATLTFERYAGSRRGRYAIDVSAARQPGGFTVLSNVIHANMSWPDQWRLALSRLETLRRAEIVETSRLHVALPCLALGTPVVVHEADVGKTSQPERFSLLRSMGFPFGVPVVMDVSEHAARFRRFLADALNFEVRVGVPVFPEPVADNTSPAP